MKRLATAAGIALAAALVSAPAASDEDGALTLRRVMLSTGGVGYFEYEAVVDGEADLSLEIRLDQVDDVLKSLVVYDDSGGIGEVSLPGREPLREAFRGLPFGAEALSSPVALLNALRGSRVESVGSREIEGQILSVREEVIQLPDGQGTLVQHRLSLMTEDGIQQVVLEEIDAVEFSDPELQAQVETALSAVAANRRQERRTLAARVTGQGERTVRAAYVVEAPLWKSSYRLTLSGDPEAGSAGLQGWAVLENLSGQDWDDVELTVVSGNPVTFRQALFDAYYVSRPEVPVEVLGRVLPRVDEGAVGRPMAEAEGMGAAAAPPAPSQAMAMMDQVFEAEERGVASLASGAVVGGAATPGEAQLLAAQSQEAATQVIFRFPNPISVPNGHSVLVPIAQRDLPAERVSVFQPATHPRHPLASVSLDNDGDTGLPPGVITLFERAADTGAVAFVGDARLATLPAGDSRLISYAVDQKVTIDREDEGAATISQGSIVDGVLRLTITDRQTTVYTIEGAPREPRTVIIEHPRQPGWSIVGADAPEMTESSYRLRQAVVAGETIERQVVMERPRQEHYRVAELAPERITFYATADELSAEVRAALNEVAVRQAELFEARNKLERVEVETQRIVQEQGRIRDNLRTVPRDSDLYRRYLATMEGQENELERLAVAAAEAREVVDSAREAMLDYARDLTL